MIIENPEQFKAWLTSVLEPLCDADPAALAKYVYALVKKDKSLDLLRVSMIEQLDVFLQKETKSFVDMLFKTLETQDYLLGEDKELQEDGSKTPPQEALATPTISEIGDISPEHAAEDTSAPIQQLNGSLPQSPVKRERKSESEKEEKEKEREKDLKEREKDKRPRSHNRLRSRTRSRSRSWERDRRRSRSRDYMRRDRERDRSRPWRNKSPPMNVRRHDRRRSRSRSTSPLRSRMRDGLDSRIARFRNRSPSPLRSRSRSPDRGGPRRLERLAQESPIGTPTQDSNHGDVDMRLSTTSQSIQSVVNVANPGFHNKRRCRDFDEKGYCMRGDLCPYDHGTDPVVLEDVNLSRVLTFGGPQGGAGANTSVADPIAQPGVAATGPAGAAVGGAGIGPNGNAPGQHLPLASLPPPHLRNQHHSNMDHMAEYNPDAPSMEPQMPWGRHPPPSGPMYGRGQRELISVPVAPHANSSEQHGPPSSHQQQQQSSQQQPQAQSQPPSHQHQQQGGQQQQPPSQQQQPQHAQSQQPHNPLKRKQTFDFNRLGPKQRAVNNQANCSLELKKVPRNLNNITQLNNHFSKFGKIVNIQVNFGGDPEAALVTFQAPNEAKSAYRSTEAVLNNRFIKVFWHNNNLNNNTTSGASENVPPAGKNVFSYVATHLRPSAKDRLGAQVKFEAPIKVEETEYVPTKRSNEEVQKPINASVASQPSTTVAPAPPVVVKTEKADKAEKVLAIKKNQEMLAVKESLKKKQEEKRKEAIKLTADLRKRKQELLDKQLAEMKSLIERVEKNPEQKEMIMNTIKTVQLSIDSLRKDLATPNNGANTQVSGPKIKTREQAQKEILDAELDLITAQQEGQDSLELQKKVLELKAQAAAITLNPTVGRGGVRVTRPPRAALSYRGRGRGGAVGYNHALASVDHRPTNLLVSGYETEEKMDVLAHFQQFGEIVSQIVDDATPSIVLNFKSRKEAELAMSKGRHFQDRTLSITWVASHQIHRGGVNNTSGSNAGNAASQRADQVQAITDEEIDLESADVEALLLDEGEEEEEEDGEARSWRR
ncbi:hypothetical protein TKK_0013140 [Trichogramma kaykai]|uniref:C3H1-type domain-containing protein n=1 Tax=Trichogramma kaykai TaxID=54128 RepID=A0ABD2WKB6_9HYME